MAITMNGAAQLEIEDYKHFDIYNDVGKDEDGRVDPLSQCQGDKAARPEMVWGVWHRAEYITVTAPCPDPGRIVQRPHIEISPANCRESALECRR